MNNIKFILGNITFIKPISMLIKQPLHYNFMSTTKHNPKEKEKHMAGGSSSSALYPLLLFKPKDRR